MDTHSSDPGMARKPDDLTVACYSFPHFHRSALNDRLYGPGWTEYVLVRGARPWFPGHHQPRQPLLGNLDEREPATWERYNALAADYGVDVFIWDWYWYGDEPVLHEALDEGFLRSSNHERVRFALMWTNHTWTLQYPTVHGDGANSRPFSYDPPQRPEQVWQSISYMIARYFHQPTYWRIDGAPVLVIYEAQRLRDTFGIAGTRQLLVELRAFARKLGLAGIHVHASHGSLPVFGDLEAMGFDSYGLYSPILLAAERRPPEEELPAYGDVAADVARDLWPRVDALSPLPCFPAVSPGWDTTPRRVVPRARTTPPNRETWPVTTIVVDETPAAFEALIRAGFAYLNERPGIPPVLTIGCWNEWTEGQYLLPDTRLGFGMIEALARALGRDLPPHVAFTSPLDDHSHLTRGQRQRMEEEENDATRRVLAGHEAGGREGVQTPARRDLAGDDGGPARGRDAQLQHLPARRATVRLLRGRRLGGVAALPGGE